MQGLIDQEILDMIPTIPENQNYWLVRANSGRFYDDFLINNYIAINTFNVSLEDLRNSKSLFDTTTEDYKNALAIGNEKETKTNISYAANRTYKFINEIQEHDIIMTPSKKTSSYLIGYASKLYNENEPLKFRVKGSSHQINYCPYNLRREVIWIKEVSFKEIDDRFLRIRNSQHTILNLNKFADFIDPLLFPFYIKKNRLFAHYAVKTNKGVTVSTWTRFQDSLYENLNEYADRTILKQNVQSPGFFSTILEIGSDVKDYINNHISFLAGVVGVLGISKVQVKYKDYDLKGILPWLFYRKEIKKQMQADIELRQAEAKLKNLEVEQLQNQLNKPAQATFVAEQVPEMEIEVRDSGDVVLPQKRTNSSQHLDEESPLIR